MRIGIVGAGMVGVATALELALDGHEVRVFDRHGGAASESSFAHAGIVCAALQAPAGGLTPLRPHHGLGHSALQRCTPGHLGWLMSARRAHRLGHAEQAARDMQTLTHLSQERMRSLRHQFQLDHERCEGLLVLLRTPAELKAVNQALSGLDEAATEQHRLIDAQTCLSIEPGLNPDTPLEAGIHLPQAEVGNAREFALLLKNEAQRLGVQFRFHTTVSQIEASSQPSLVHCYTPPEQNSAPHAASRVDESRSSEGPATAPYSHEPERERFDAIVICAAQQSTALLRPLGIPLHLYALTGCSITAQLRQMEAFPHLGPQGALIDLKHQISISRIGQRVRVSGGAQLGPLGGAREAQVMAALHKVLHDWFPGAAQGGVQRWRGVRSIVADGLPVLGKSSAPGIWLNLAHGSSGWAQACGSARMLAEQIAGVSDTHTLSSLTPDRASLQ